MYTFGSKEKNKPELQGGLEDERRRRKGVAVLMEFMMGGEWVFFEAYSDDEAYATALQEVEESEMPDSYAPGDYF
ncbi:hypothetical protein F2Q69_00028437 [Brassica cretica]|uniref:Uncharacterized protein n=1 Tax=Brassica cretica TaxID=69181 RepID=A0A8S9RSG5_BRACR|nr:hypothetical protein F2Q69_00028437 [Brassica cretica]